MIWKESGKRLRRYNTKPNQCQNYAIEFVNKKIHPVHIKTCYWDLSNKNHNIAKIKILTNNQFIGNIAHYHTVSFVCVLRSWNNYKLNRLQSSERFHTINSLISPIQNAYILHHFVLSEIARRRNIIWIQIKDENKANKVLYQFLTEQMEKYP